jgi:hypothetical protein
MGTIQAGNQATVPSATRVTAMEALEFRLRGGTAEKFNRETEAIRWLEAAFSDYEAALKYASTELTAILGAVEAANATPNVEAARALTRRLREKVNGALYRQKVS